MTPTPSPPKPRDPRIWLPLKALVLASAALAGAGVLAMTAVTCLDIVMRQFGRPLVGAWCASGAG